MMSSIRAIALANAIGGGGGGGGSIDVVPLSVTQNGTYTAPSGKAYSPVTVNVAGISLDNVDVFVGDYTNDPVTITLGAIDKYYRRIYGQ